MPAHNRRPTAKDQKAKQEAESKVDGLEQQIVQAHADVAGQVERLKAEKELLAQRDLDARNELERLRLTRAPE